jgi:ribosomal protein L37AE/L43A
MKRRRGLIAVYCKNCDRAFEYKPSSVSEWVCKICGTQLIPYRGGPVDSRSNQIAKQQLKEFGLSV